ncbi:MAG: hypothetical protein K2M79_00945 [Muribaculaceae bacterium]|nr:hypothetical protein [Muribaculaceae bacterium]
MKKLLTLLCLCYLSALLVGCNKNKAARIDDRDEDETEEVSSSRDNFDYTIFMDLNNSYSAYDEHKEKLKSIISNSESSDAELMAATMFFIHSGNSDAQEIALEGYDKLKSRKADIGKLMYNFNERMQMLMNAKNLEEWAEQARTSGYAVAEATDAAAPADSAVAYVEEAVEVAK